ncbi:MAG: hypothetical protein WDO18_12650 [Acidobacteriota bacterium]
MLRITVDENDDRWQMRLEGKLSGEWVRETGAVWASAPNKRREIDLRGVTGTDDAGKGYWSPCIAREPSCSPAAWP